MKQLECKAMGGDPECSEVITGSNPQEMIEKGWGHLMQAHPELGKKIQDQPKEVNDKWMADFAANFDNLPEV